MFRSFLSTVLAFVWIAIFLLIATPFLLSSLALDRSGVPLTATVDSKHEILRVNGGSWSRSPEVLLKYLPPDSPVPGTLRAVFTTTEYDGLHVGNAVPIRYLPERDLPAVPLAHLLRQIHALPEARLAGRRTFSAFETFFRARFEWIEVAAMATVFLVLLRVTKSPAFAWVAGAAVILAFALLMLHDFPRPVPAPETQVLQAVGSVRTMHHISRLFEGNRSRGLLAEQPVDVVGIEFVPAGRIDPVLAVDLIDAGSIEGLEVNSAVSVDYDGTSPRVARIRNARRDFATRNLQGIAFQAVTFAAGMALLLLMAIWFERKAKGWIRTKFNRMPSSDFSQWRTR
jgi:hypothetical protein